MAEKLGNIDLALKALEHQYVEHKEKFEKWKKENVKQHGTETYNKYLEQFKQWETGVQEKQKQLARDRENLLASDLDLMAEDVLSNISMADFVLAVTKMTSKEPSFFPHLLSTFQQFKWSGEAVHNMPQTYPAGLVYQQHSIPAYMPPYAMSGTAVAHPYAAPMTKDVTLSGKNIGISTATSDAWKVEDASKRHTYRPPSPVRDYRNPSNLPFRDFSQT
ncbi:hypothetical protein AB6A40_008410 [Gnathostoma spinigerum]|uniref:Uncharacterized protein n=1 Tax=Gnathostoma spinigerum TaxID=75299 RepID=A0ABD6EW33_9BILA